MGRNTKREKNSVAQEGVRWRLAPRTKPHAPFFRLAHRFCVFFCTETQLTERLLEETNL